MADLTISSDTSLAQQAYDLAQQNATSQTQKSGKNVVGTAQNAAAASTLGAAAVTGAEATDAVGGVSGAQTQAKAVTTNTDAPSLPNPTGTTATPAATMRVVKGSDVFASGGDGVFAALEAMSDARQKDINSAMLVKRLQGADQVTAKKQEMLDKQTEVHGMEKSADTKLAGSMIGLTATGVMTFGGAKMEKATKTKEDSDTASQLGKTQTADAAAVNKVDDAAGKTGSSLDKEKEKVQADLQAKTGDQGQNSTTVADQAVSKNVVKNENAKGTTQSTTGEVKPGRLASAKEYMSDRQAWGATLRNTGMNVSGTVDAVVNMIDVNVGGQNQVNQAQVAQKLDGVQGQIYQNNADSAGAWLDNAKDQRKSAQQAIMTHVQMWGDSANNVWK